MRKSDGIQNFSLLVKNHIKNFGSDRMSKNLISSILVANLFYTVVRYSREITAGGNPYLTGDWLINYEGGYNGRGLFGQIILWLSDASNINLLWTVYTSQILLYFIYFPIVISILRRIENPYVWMIGLSPSFVMFDFLDTGGAFRKELLGFVSLILVIHLITRGILRKSSLIISIFVFIVFLFSWDAAFCFVPFYIYIFSILRSREIISRKFFSIFVGTFLTLGVTSIFRAAYFQFHRPPSISDGICESLTSRGISSKICGGTIRSITELKTDPINMVTTLILDYHFELYFVLLLFGLLPFLLNGWLKNHKGITLMLFASILPLLVTGADYGRWIHIFGTFVTLAWLIDDEKFLISAVHVNSRTIMKTGTLHFLMFSFIFTTAWRIPHVWGSPQDSFLGLAGRIISWISG
jgi:hypothetical protein